MRNLRVELSLVMYRREMCSNSVEYRKRTKMQKCHAFCCETFFSLSLPFSLSLEIAVVAHLFFCLICFSSMFSHPLVRVVSYCVTTYFFFSLLSGPIPTELGMLSWLERLDLSKNQLTGVYIITQV